MSITEHVVVTVYNAVQLGSCNIAGAVFKNIIFISVKLFLKGENMMDEFSKLTAERSNLFTSKKLMLEAVLKGYY
jgi:hypothetical protein